MFQRLKANLPGNWHLITEPEALVPEKLAAIAPRFIFFPHWSWVVPRDVLERWECVCFHMTDVPYGRGGSPLQNLIVRGHTHTKVTALRMVEALDAGPVYGKIELSLEGAAGVIYERLSEKIYELIDSLIQEEPASEPQRGEPTVFERRTPEQSQLPESGGLRELYDHIRMLDAETYPKGFLQYGEYRLEFTGAEIGGNETLTANVRIVRQTDANDK